jgi:valyl-tRNA synthetase
MFAENKSCTSLQASPWPEFNAAVADEEAEKHGDLIVAVIGEVRREKAEKQLPLNTQIKNLTIYSGNAQNACILRASEGDIVGTIKAVSVTIVPEKKREGRQISPYDVYIQTEY